MKASEYDQRSVAVTGGTGFIGSRLAERLTLESTCAVRVQVRSWSSAAWVCRTRAELVPGDVTDLDSLRALFRGVDTVFHCVGIGGSREACHQTNVLGTRNVLEAAAAEGVRRVVYLSTVGVHGPTLHEGLTEAAPFQRLGHIYADSKIEAEELLWREAAERSLEVSVVRPTYVWGPASRLFTVTPIQQLKADRFYLVNRGRGACNAVFVDNLIDLCLVCGVHPRAVGEAFLVRDPDRLTWGEFFEYYRSMVGVQRLRSVRGTARLGPRINRALRPKLIDLQESLYRRILRWDARRPLLTRYGLRAPCKALHLTTVALDELLPAPYDWWDLRKYSSPGHIDLAKSENLLGFTPRIPVQQGMQVCREWLRSQAYLPS